MNLILKKITNTKTVLAIAGAFLLILNEFGLSVDNERIMEIVRLISYIFVLLGVFNNEGMDSTHWNI